VKQTAFNLKRLDLV